MIADIIIVTIVIAIVASIIIYLVRAKRRGETCVGCPYAKQCGGGQCSSKSNKVATQGGVHNHHNHSLN